MIFKKSLTKLILLGSLTLFVNGCKVNHEKHLSAKINNEQIWFTEGNNFVLKVYKEDGTEISYYDNNRDLILDKLVIKNRISTTEYYRDSKDPFDNKLTDDRQTDFDKYLSRIKEIQSSQSK